MRICVCGGGHLGHVCSGVLGSHDDVVLNIFSRNPLAWNESLTIKDQNNNEFVGKINLVTDNPELAIKDVDIVFLCLPGYAIKSTLECLHPYIKKNQILGSIVSSTGFFFMAHEILGKETKLFGFQRTPYIARMTEYGHSADLLGYKKEVRIAVENIENKDSFCKTIERLFITPTVVLNNFYEASLSNSNPILHTGRLYSMWKDWHGEIYNRNILFYKEWTDEASEVIITMDNEFMSLLDKLSVDKKNIPTLLDYYESTDAHSLTAKIKSIPAFQTIMSPMKQVEGGWLPDFNSRYFTEDFPYGLKFIKDLAIEHQVAIPKISEVYSWGMRCVGETIYMK